MNSKILLSFSQRYAVSIARFVQLFKIGIGAGNNFLIERILLEDVTFYMFENKVKSEWAESCE